MKKIKHVKIYIVKIVEKVYSRVLVVVILVVKVQKNGYLKVINFQVEKNIGIVDVVNVFVLENNQKDGSVVIGKQAERIQSSGNIVLN